MPGLFSSKNIKLKYFSTVKSWKFENIANWNIRDFLKNVCIYIYNIYIIYIYNINRIMHTYAT